MQSDLQNEKSAVGEYIGVLAVDVRGYSKYNSDRQKTITDLLPEIMRHAAVHARVDRLWQQSGFAAPRGDGYLIGFDPDLLSGVIDRFIDALQVELRRNSSQFRALGVEIRLRAAVDLGPVHAFDETVTDSPSGGVMVNAARLADTQEVRALLEYSDPAVTFVAAAVSQSVMKDVILAGRSIRQPSEFVETQLKVQGKDYSEVGYLRVPAASGELLRSGLLFDDDAETTPVATDEVGSTPVAGERNDSSVEVGFVDGDVQLRSIRDISSGQSIVGDGNEMVGRDRQEFSGTFLAGADANFGASSGRRVGLDPSAQER